MISWVTSSPCNEGSPHDNLFCKAIEYNQDSLQVKNTPREKSLLIAVLGSTYLHNWGANSHFCKACLLQQLFNSTPKLRVSTLIFLVWLLYGYVTCPMSLVWLELLELMKGRSGVALTQFSSSSSSNHSSTPHHESNDW